MDSHQRTLTASLVAQGSARLPYIHSKTDAIAQSDVLCQDAWRRRRRYNHCQKHPSARVSICGRPSVSAWALLFISASCRQILRVVLRRLSSSKRAEVGSWQDLCIVRAPPPTCRGRPRASATLHQLSAPPLYVSPTYLLQFFGAPSASSFIVAGRGGRAKGAQHLRTTAPSA